MTKVGEKVPTGPTITEVISSLKKRKLDDGVKLDRLQCEFFLQKKNRYCSMTRRSDSKYCAEHSSTTIEERVKCPKDPSHSIWLKNLNKHLKKCNATKDLKVIEPCFEENLNWEKIGGDNNHNHYVSIQDDKDNFMIFLNELDSNFTKLIKDELPLEDEIDKDDESLKSRFEELSNKKHIIQQSSIISHLLKIGLIDKSDQRQNNNLIMEFGCGKLELSRYVNKFLNSKNIIGDYLLIDRSSPRLKFDTKFIKDFQELSNSNDKLERKIEFNSCIKRYKIDIKDLNLDKAISLDFKHDSNFFAISKHLCGVATDLTLRCCLNSKKFRSRNGKIIIAMCCRHVCSYDQLLNGSKEYLEKNFGIDKYKFDNYLIKLSSWATCGKRDDDDDLGNSSIKIDDDDDEQKKKKKNEHFTGLNYEQRLSIGLKARRIIDESRRYAMEQQGFKVKICKYVKSDISLENNLLICSV